MKPKFMTSNEEFYYNDLQKAIELLQDFWDGYKDLYNEYGRSYDHYYYIRIMSDKEGSLMEKTKDFLKRLENGS